MRSFIAVLVFLQVTLILQSQNYSWRYYRPGNTGILGDYSEAIWIDHDGNPYIAAYSPGWEEGGFSKYFQQDNIWINYSNLDYAVMGSNYDVGSSRISDIVEDSEGTLWMATWRGILKFDPSVGGSSLQFWGEENSLHPGGRTKDIDFAPDGTVWAAIISVEWGFGGLVRYDPSTDQWLYWGYGSTSNNWPSLIGQCEYLSIQAKPGGDYVVWIDGEGWNTMITYDSDTQLFTLLPQNYVTGEVVSLPGKDCIDDEGNLWALRVTNPGEPFSLDYRTPGGTWISPVQPQTFIVNDIGSFKAYGTTKALIAGPNSEVFQFDGTSWQSKGIWREGSYTYSLDIDPEGNIWASGIEGAARREASTGTWQRHRVTNSSQIDYWVEDISIDGQGNIWMTGNAGPGVGGFQMFDGTNWTGFNEYTYGLGYPFPFPTDNTEAICYRPSNEAIVINPMYNYLHSWDGSSYSSLNFPESRSRGLVEDSQNRLWSLGEYYSLYYFDDENTSWTSVPIISWGLNIRKDPIRPGTIWACTYHQVVQTDGINNFYVTVEDFPELDPQSDVFTSVIPSSDGFAWIGSNQGLFRLDPENGSHLFFSPGNSEIPGENLTPLAYSPDGRLWFTNFGSSNAFQIGLCWFDGSGFGIFPTEDSGLPHAQIPDMEIREVLNGYELWMSCLSMGIAVLQVITDPVIILTHENPQADISVKSYPNPFKDHTIISFSLPEAGVTDLSIFDINGRMIRNIVSASYPAGTSSVQWDGNDHLGRKISPGVYLCRLISGNHSRSIMIINQH